MKKSKNTLMINIGMCLIVGGIMYTAYYESFMVPVGAIISCGVCLSICGLQGMISQKQSD